MMFMCGGIVVGVRLGKLMLNADGLASKVLRGESVFVTGRSILIGFCITFSLFYFYLDRIFEDF